CAGNQPTCGPQAHHTSITMLAPGTGTARWSRSVDLPFASLIEADSETVYAANGEGTVVALDARTGKERWRRDLRHVASGGEVADGITSLAVAPHEGVVAGLLMTSGIGTQGVDRAVTISRSGRVGRVGSGPAVASSSQVPEGKVVFDALTISLMPEGTLRG